MLRTTLTVVACCALFAVAGCKSDGDATTQADISMGMVNETCPIMGSAVDPNTTVEYHGATIGFCCAGCVPKWEAKSDAEKADYIASQK